MLILPKDPDTLAKAIEYMAMRGDSIRRTRLPEWIINRAYLDGVRDFGQIDYRSGRVEFTYLNQNGKLRFKNEEVLRYYQVEMGRFLGIDIRPSVKMRGWGLDRMRSAAIGQTILDYEVDDAVLAKVRFPFNEDLLTLGGVGLGAWVEDAGLLSGKSILEVISPWELLPIPYNARSPLGAVGIMRVRLVSYKWLLQNELIKAKLRSLQAKDKDALQVKEMDYGEFEAANQQDVGVQSVIDLFASGFQSMTEQAYPGDADGARKTREGRQVAKVTELWLRTTEGLVTRYIMKVGKSIVVDEDYDKTSRNVWMPIHYARYYPAGFYGRSYIGPMIPFNDRSEKCLEAIFQNMIDMDAHGILALPTTLGITDRSFRVNSRPKKLYYSPDPLEPSTSPSQLQPYTTGTFPKQVMESANGYLNRLAGQSEMFTGGAPGRTDSMAGFGFLLETNNVGIEAPGNAIADVFTGAYSAILAASKQRLTTSDNIRILNLETIPAGVVVDNAGVLRLDKNPIPDPRDVKINIKSRTPPSPTQQVQQLTEMLQNQIIDQRGFRLAVYRKGLDVEVGNEDEFQAWRKIRLMIRTLFNDGETPNVRFGEGLIAVDPNADSPDIALAEIGTFMKSPEYALASAAVKNAFGELKEQYEMMIGKFPQQVPTPDAIGQPQGAAGQPGMAGPPMPPGQM